MKIIVTSLIVAGVVYYFCDRKGAEKLFKNILDSATNALEKTITEIIQ